MSAPDADAAVQVLKAENERLTRELDQACSEKIQSAQYGLVLLEEKDSLQQRCEELEGMFEKTQHELNITQEVSISLILVVMLYLRINIPIPRNSRKF